MHRSRPLHVAPHHAAWYLLRSLDVMKDRWDEDARVGGEACGTLARRVEALERENERMRRLLDASPDGYLRVDASGVVRWANREAERLFGYEPGGLIGRMVEELVPEELRSRHVHHRAAFTASPQARDMAVGRELVGLRRDGSLVPIEIRLARTTDDVVVTIRDASERRRQAARLAEALRDKDVLLREVNHRIKNNLQLVSSLLRLQALEAPKRVARSLEEACRRIRAMAMVHEWLSRDGGGTTVDFGAFVRQLVDQLQRSLAPPGVRVHVRAPQGAPLSVDRAVRCGLMLHELVSNAFEHAFPSERAVGSPPEVIVEVAFAPDAVELRVRDNGVGLVQTQAGGGSLGLEIVELLASQAGGRLTVCTDGGTEVRVRCSTALDE